MTPPVSELIELLSLERLEDNLFRGQSRDIGTRFVFGGQVLGQALSAAQATIDPATGARAAHSLHAYFLRAGDIEHPIVYLPSFVQKAGCMVRSACGCERPSGPTASDRTKRSKIAPEQPDHERMAIVAGGSYVLSCSSWALRSATSATSFLFDLVRRAISARA